MSLDGDCGKSGQADLPFAWCCLLAWVYLCMPGQYRVFQPLAPIIAASRRDRLATEHCRSSTGISACPFIQQRMVELTKFWGGLSILAQFIPNMFYGVAVWQSCRLLHFGDVALLKKIKDYLSTVMCGVIFLVNSLRPRVALRGSPEHLKRNRVILTHICVTREMRAIFHDAYMRPRASLS